jgi:transposase
MKAYSVDLRERVIIAAESGQYSQAEVSEQFRVSQSFVEKLLHRWHTTGDVSPKLYTPGPTRVLEPYRAWIRAAVCEQPDSTLEELCEQLEEDCGITAHPSMMWRELEWLELPLKKSRSTTLSGRRHG